MKFREWFSPPRRLLALFLTVILVPAAALVWLGWRVLEQDRTVEAQRLQERLEAAADRATDALIRRLKELESIPRQDLPDGALGVAFSAKGVVAQPPGRLLFWPTAPLVSGPPVGTFVAGEVLEFQKQDYPAAAEAYRQLAASGDPAIRAGACLRVARCLRKSAHPEQANSRSRNSMLARVPPFSSLPRNSSRDLVQGITTSAVPGSSPGMGTYVRTDVSRS